MTERPDLLLNALRDHAERIGHASPDAAANDTVAALHKITRGFALRPFTINELMRKESANGR